MRDTWNNVLRISICALLQPLHPVNPSDNTVSPRTAVIYLIFSLELTHAFFVLALALVPQHLDYECVGHFVSRSIKHFLMFSFFILGNSFQLKISCFDV